MAIQSTDSGGRSCIVYVGFAHRLGEETAYNCREPYTPLLQGHRDCVLGYSAEKKLASLPLSNDTIKRRIRDMADDVEHQLVAEILGAPLNTFSIQLDE